MFQFAVIESTPIMCLIKLQVHGTNDKLPILPHIVPSWSRGVYRTPRAIFGFKCRAFTTSKGNLSQKESEKYRFLHKREKWLFSSYKFHHIKIYISKRRLLKHDSVSITNVQLSLKSEETQKFENGNWKMTLGCSEAHVTNLWL